MKKIILILALLMPVAAMAQTPVVTKPAGVTSNNSSSTIAATNTFQSIFAANTNRTACTIQNLGTHSMFVFFGPIANAISNNSVTLVAGDSVRCNNGNIVLQDQVSITGTLGDAFFAAKQ